jgi:hypothetical protein
MANLAETSDILWRSRKNFKNKVPRPRFTNSIKIALTWLDIMKS